jgi:hypothetical protein
MAARLRPNFRRLVVLSALAAAFCATPARAADDVAALTAVGPNGKGAPAAREARARLAARGAEVLPRLLAAMDTPNVVAANWCRTLFDELVARERKAASPKLPVALFKEYVAEAQRQGRARRLVLDLVDELEPEFRAGFIPTRLDDAEFREEAVAAVVKQGDDAKKRGEDDAARTLYRTAFRSARSSEQLTLAQARLKESGETVDIIEQMGFVIDWQLLGPFDAPEKTGFAKTFPPETRVDLDAKYTGKDDAEIRWKRHRTGDALGQVDLIPSVAGVNEAVAYAYAEIECKGGKAELRCSADDNLSVWLDGEKVLAREQWLNGTRLDRFAVPVTLKPGVNKILVKICQGPQHANPEVPSNWTFQLRLCETDGLGVKFQSRLPASDP